MLEANAKSKGVSSSYQRCDYEGLVYAKFESNFVSILAMLA